MVENKNAPKDEYKGVTGGNEVRRTMLHQTLLKSIFPLETQ